MCFSCLIENVWVRKSGERMGDVSEKIESWVGLSSVSSKDHLYRMVIVEVQQYLTKPNVVSDQSELTILLCQPMNNLLLMKMTLP